LDGAKIEAELTQKEKHVAVQAGQYESGIIDLKPLATVKTELLKNRP